MTWVSLVSCNCAFQVGCLSEVSALASAGINLTCNDVNNTTLRSSSVHKDGALADLGASSDGYDAVAYVYDAKSLMESVAIVKCQLFV